MPVNDLAVDRVRELGVIQTATKDDNKFGTDLYDDGYGYSCAVIQALSATSIRVITMAEIRSSPLQESPHPLIGQAIRS